MKIFTILKCLIRFLNLLFTILKFFVDMMSVMWRKFPLTEVVMPSNKKPLWGPGPPASQAPPSSAEQGIIRCRAGVGGQGWHRGDGKPEGPDRPLEKGGGGIEISKSSRRQPRCCCQWHLSTSIRYMWCTWTLRKSDYPWETRNSTRAIRLLGFTNFGESAWMFSFLQCEAVLLATMKPYYCKRLTQKAQFVRKQVGFHG